MTEINELNQIDAVSGDDLLPIWDQSNGSGRNASVSQLATFLGNGGTATQYSTPTATGFSISAAVGWLVIQPLATYAAGTIVLPTAATHGDELSVACTQIITALTISGATVGAPTALTAGGHFTLRYDVAGAVWFRVA